MIKPEVLKDKLIPGNKFKIHYGNKKSGNKTIHIRSVVDDGYYVFKVWVNPRWRYRIEPFIYFHLRCNEITYLGKS